MDQSKTQRNSRRGTLSHYRKYQHLRPKRVNSRETIGIPTLVFVTHTLMQYEGTLLSFSILTDVLNLNSSSYFQGTNGKQTSKA